MKLFVWVIAICIGIAEWRNLISRHQATGLCGIDAILVAIGSYRDGEWATSVFSTALATALIYWWWRGGGDDDTKRRLRRIRKAFTPTRRTAPAGA